MAQLKDTTVSGSLRATDTIYSTTIQAQILKAPTISNGATYGPGTNGQVLKSNGTSVYWGTDSNSVTGVKGNSESSYRTGNVNITASNIGLGNVENTKLSTWTGSTNISTVGTITSGTWNATTIGAGYGGTGQSTYTVGDILYCGTANTLSKLGGNTTTTRKFLRSVATTSGTAVAPAWDTVTKTDVGLSNVTNDAQVKASLGTAKGDMLYWSANATPARLAIGTAGYFLKATADGPVWANTTDITALGTITTGTWQGTTVGTGYGGTGVASHTANRLVYSTSATTIQATNNHYVSDTQISINLTSAPHSGYTLLVNGHSEISGALSLQQPNSSTQSLYFKNHTSTVLGVGARIYYWNGSASGITHSQLNFQEYSYSTTASATPSSYYEEYSLPDCTAGLSANASYDIITNKYHYFSSTQASINSTTAPDSGYALKVNGALETTNLINIITNSRTKDIYFSNGTPGSCSNVGRIMYDVASATGITKSQFGFIEYSYPATAGASALAYSENYYLPSANAGLGASVAYNILTDKNVYPFPMCARQVSSSMTFDDMNAPGVYAVANNIKSTNTYPTSQTNAKYGILVVFGGTNTSNTAGNAMQLWFSGITNAGYYKLAIRAKYNGTWGAWSVIH